MQQLVERFLEYVKFDTQSDENTNLTPSTPGQMVFANYLKGELEKMGLSEISLDDNGYLMATLPANTTRQVPTIGFIAHLDTSSDMSGHNVKPRIVENYDGKPITLNEENNIVLSPEQFPELQHYVGQDLIVTDGNTLLGADDKAGIAEIISAVAYLQHTQKSSTAKYASPSILTKKSVLELTNLTLNASALTSPTPWTAAKLANWNLKTSTLL